MINRQIIFLIFILSISIFIRLYQLSFFEFKNDQLQAIELGNEARNKHFCITHGTASGVAINNPPFFIIFMGIITLFTNNPLYITFYFTVINILALILAIRYFYCNLPKNYAVFSSILLAFSPAFIIYSGIIWAQCLLPVLMILFHISLYKFISENKPNQFIILGIIAALASQLHMSGFFLFPVLMILSLYYRKAIGAKRILLTIAIITIIYSSYLYHLFYEGEWRSFIPLGSLNQRSIYWKLFREHIRMASFDFFRHYFRYDFAEVLNKSVGIFKIILYPLSCILIAVYAFGFISYLRWLIKTKKPFDTSKDALKRYPLVFQIAGFITIVITLGYLLLRIQTLIHYLIVLFPCYSIIAGFTVYRLWRFVSFRIIFYASLLSTIILLISILLFLNKAGGHPHEYGPSYKLLSECKDEIWKFIPQGYCPKLTIICENKGKYDKEAMAAIMLNKSSNKCTPAMPLFPMEFNITWNPDLMRYEYIINEKYHH